MHLPNANEQLLHLLNSHGIRITCPTTQTILATGNYDHIDIDIDIAIDIAIDIDLDIGIGIGIGVGIGIGINTDADTDICTTTQIILATAGYDHTIKFWAADTGVCTRTLQHPDSQVKFHPKANLTNLYFQVNSLEVAPDGSMLAAGGYQHIRSG